MSMADPDAGQAQHRAAEGRAVPDDPPSSAGPRSRATGGPSMAPAGRAAGRRRSGASMCRHAEGQARRRAPRHESPSPPACLPPCILRLCHCRAATSARATTPAVRPAPSHPDGQTKRESTLKPMTDSDPTMDAAVTPSKRRRTAESPTPPPHNNPPGQQLRGHVAARPARCDVERGRGDGAPRQVHGRKTTAPSSRCRASRGLGAFGSMPPGGEAAAGFVSA